MEKFYNEKNEFDEELYDNYARARRRRIKAFILGLSMALPVSQGIHELTKEEITINGYKLQKGQYETLFNPKTLDTAIITDAYNEKLPNDSDYCLDVLSNRVVLRDKYEEGYYTLDLMEMIKDNSVKNVKTGINKYTVLPGRVKSAAQVKYAFDYLNNNGIIDERALYEEPAFDLIMINDFCDNYKAVQLSPTQDLALYDSESNGFVYVHLDKEDSRDLLTGNKVDLNEFIGASPINIFHLVENEKLPARKIERESDNGKPLYEIRSTDLVATVFYECGQHVLSIGGK